MNQINYDKLWHIHYYREFGHWAVEKTTDKTQVIKCDLCNRLTESNPDTLNITYCRRMKIHFRCGSCMFPQYRNTLKCPTRGNVDRIYGKKFNVQKNKWF